jgi:glycosyltransferase involved in cell wall biosynthesis
MNILLITTLYPGHQNQGRNKVSYAIHYFAQEWVKQGHHIRVIRPWVKYPKIFNFTTKAKMANKYGFNERLSIDCVNVDRITINKIPKINYTQEDIKYIYNKAKNIIDDGFKPDVILCHMINPSLYIGLLLKREFNIPLILTMHATDLINLSKKSDKFKDYNRIRNSIDGLGFRSDKLRREYNKLYNRKGDPTNQFIIHSGIDNKFIINQQDINKKEEKKINNIFVASNLIPLKNVDIVIKAFNKLNNKEIFLEIAGDGSEEKKLKALAEDSTVRENIKFLGRLNRDRILEKMRESDIFVMVSSPETFGLVYLEAMASGCIVIGSKGEGIDGVIKNGDNGYLCTPRDADELENIFAKILEMSKVDKAKILSNALNTVKKMTQEEMSMKYIEQIVNIFKIC